MPVPGTITPEPEPVEVESDAALPSASTTETCVVPPGGAGSGDAAQVARAIRRAPRELASAKQPRGEPAAVEPREKLPPRARPCSRITSTSAAIASALPAGVAGSRSSSASP